MPTARLPLVGRRDEMAALEDEFARAAAGEFRVVLLSGEAGVGKSRLGRELLARHPEAAGLFARAHPLGVTAAFGVWAEAIDPLLQGRSDRQVVAACGGLLDDLASLFHRVAVIRGSLPDREPPLPRLLQGLASMLRNLASQAPVIAVLDDVHFADASSWEALRYFARHLDETRLLVVATSRPADLAGQEVAARALFELDEDGFLQRLEVIPLDRTTTRELAETIIGQPPPAALVDWVGQRAQGNPLYVISLVRALLEEHADLSAPRLRQLPEGLTERMAARTRGADATRRGVLDMLAVVDRPLPVADLAALTGMSAEQLDPILASLIAGRAVAEGERAGELTYEIAHPLIKDVIYQQISGARKRTLHRQAARSLLESGRLAEAALHFARSAQPGDEEAVRVLLDAMRQAEQREAFRESLDLLSELVDIVPPTDPRWLDVLEAMYWQAEWVVDHRAETGAETAVRALRAIDSLLVRTADARRATVKFRLANFLAWGTGELSDAEDACREAVRLFEAAGEQRQALLARREIGWIRYLRGDIPGMTEESARVVAAAEALGDRFVAMQGLVAFGYSNVLRARFADAEPAIRRAVAIAEQDEKAYRLTAAMSLLAAAVTLQGRGAESVPLFEQARSANPAYRDTILVELETFVYWMAGDFTSAVVAARELAAWVVSGVKRRALGLACGGLAAAETGDLHEAERLLSQARQGLGGRDWAYFFRYVRYGEAILAWHTGHAAECADTLAEVAAALIGMDAPAVSVFVLIDLAEAAGDAHDAQAAASAAGQLEDVARLASLRPYRGAAAAAGAWAALAGGQPDVAVTRAVEAVALLSGTGWRSHLGRAHDVLGRSLAAAGRPGAVAELERAAAIFAECGATWRRNRSVQALRRLGSGGRRAAAATLGPAALTRREREVARLAARGMSAKAIAEVLFIGERTVESHLSSTYAKLGVESKLDLIRRAAEFGLS
jgi:DNA-binding CsgD family transcriptional regulator/tetratricopeptide (TPR) repeat protein